MPSLMIDRNRVVRSCTGCPLAHTSCGSTSDDGRVFQASVPGGRAEIPTNHWFRSVVYPSEGVTNAWLQNHPTGGSENVQTLRVWNRAGVSHKENVSNVICI